MSRWGAAILAVVCVTVLYADLGRLVNPIGEKDLPGFPPGQNDFSLVFVGAQALVAGVNPYRNDRKDLVAPFHSPWDVGGTMYKQVYPPTSMLILVPLAWITHDWMKAGRIWFHLSLLVLAGLAAIAWALLRRLGDPTLSPLWIAVLFVCLALNVGVELGLERGQLENLMACMSWGALLLFVRRNYASAMFLIVGATAIKGYPALLAAGLGLLALDRRSWKRALAGGLLGLVVFLLPVARYLGDGVKAVLYRTGMFWDFWYNNSFRNVVNSVAPSWAGPGARVLSLIALAATGLCWWNARRAMRAGSPRFELWLILFATCAMTTMIGVSTLSVCYDVILMLPGALLVGLAHGRLAGELALSSRAAHALGAALLVTIFLLFVYRIDLGKVHTSRSGLPAAGFGLVAWSLVAGAVAIRALMRRPSSTAATATSAKPNGITSTV